AEVRGPCDVLEVLERPRLEVVDADDAVVARQKVLAEVRSQESGAAGYETGGHLASDCNSAFHAAGRAVRDIDTFRFFSRPITQNFAICDKYRSFSQLSKPRVGSSVFSPARRARNRPRQSAWPARGRSGREGAPNREPRVVT